MKPCGKCKHCHGYRFDSDISEFEGFSPSDIEDRDDPTFEIGPDISVSPVSTPEMRENEVSDEEEVRNYTWSEKSVHSKLTSLYR